MPLSAELAGQFLELLRGANEAADLSELKNFIRTHQAHIELNAEHIALFEAIAPEKLQTIYQQYFDLQFDYRFQHRNDSDAARQALGDFISQNQYGCLFIGRGEDIHPALNLLMDQERPPFTTALSLTSVQRAQLESDESPNLAVLHLLYPDLGDEEQSNELLTRAKAGSAPAAEYLADRVDDLPFNCIMFLYPKNSGETNEAILQDLATENSDAIAALRLWDNPSATTIAIVYNELTTEDQMQLIRLAESGCGAAKDYLKDHVNEHYCEAALKYSLDINNFNDRVCLAHLSLQDGNAAVAERWLSTVWKESPAFREFADHLTSNRIKEAASMIENTDVSIPPDIRQNMKLAIWQYSMQHPDNVDCLQALVQLQFPASRAEEHIRATNPALAHLAKAAQRLLAAGIAPCDKSRCADCVTLIVEQGAKQHHDIPCLQWMNRTLTSDDTAQITRVQPLVDQIANRAPRNAEVQYQVAMFHHHLRGIPINEEPVKQRLKQAARLGHVQALKTAFPDHAAPNQLYNLAREGYHAAVVQLQTLAEQKNEQGVQAQKYLGLCFYRGHGVKTNTTMAETLLRHLPPYIRDEDTVKSALEDIHAAERRSTTSEKFVAHEIKEEQEKQVKLFEHDMVYFHMMNAGVGSKPIKFHGEDVSVSGYDSEKASRMHHQLVSKYTCGDRDYIGFTKKEMESFEVCLHKDLELFDSVKLPHYSIVERLHHGETVTVGSGWLEDDSKHAIRLSFKKIGNDVYLLYGNRGSQSDEANVNGLRCFKVDNYELLDNPDVLKKLQIDLSKRDYIEGFDASKPGISQELGLHDVGRIGKTYQKSGKCAIASADFALLSNMVFCKLEQAATSGHDINQEALGNAYTASVASYKYFREFSNDYSFNLLIDLGRDRGAGKPRIAVETHQMMLRHLLNYAMDKHSGSGMANLHRREEKLSKIKAFLESTDADDYPGEAKASMLKRMQSSCPSLFSASADDDTVTSAR